MPSKRDVWEDWITEYVKPEPLVPLFETDKQGAVVTKSHGTDNRPILCRSNQMEERLRKEGWKVVEDWKNTDDTYEGVIYIMYALDGDFLLPRYIGRAGKYGRDGQRLNNNLKNIRTNNSKLARWGDGYDYHIGDLSAAVLKHHEDESVNQEKDPEGKYQGWADALFQPDTNILREPVYFWAKAWRIDDNGPFYGFETSLNALEYNLINLGSDLYPDSLLNSEGA
jgi:hypothetical protein